MKNDLKFWLLCSANSFTQLMFFLYRASNRAFMSPIVAEDPSITGS